MKNEHDSIDDLGDGTLTGIRVLDFSEGVAGPLGAMLLADHGADVWKVESPDGDRLRGTPAAHVLNRGKRGLTVDQNDPQCMRIILQLLDTADVVIWDCRPHGPVNDAIVNDAVARRPNLIVAKAPAYGTRGPLADAPQDEHLVSAIAGIFSSSPARRDGPVYEILPVVSCGQGVLVALATVAALHRLRTTGSGSVFEISGMDAGFVYQTGTLISVGGAPLDAARRQPSAHPTFRYCHANDGWFFLGAAGPNEWRRLAPLLGMESLANDARYRRGPLGLPPEEMLRLKDEVDQVIASHPRQYWMERLVEADVPVGTFQSRSEYMDEPQVRALDMVVAVDDPELGPTEQMGIGVRMQSLPGRVRGGAPRLGQTGLPDWEPRPPLTTPAGAPEAPLAGIKVLDLGTYIAGAYASTLLADLGADVIKVEPPGGDPWRAYGPQFWGYNRTKRSVVLDLKSEPDRERLLQLVRGADLVIDNLRPGVMSRLGLDHARLAERNSEIVTASTSANGSIGAMSQRPAYDPVFQARSGSSHQEGGHFDGEPPMRGAGPNDNTTGTMTALAAALALFARTRTGQAQHAESSLLQGSMTAAATEFIRYPGRPEAEVGGCDPLGRSALRRAYRCRDGRWLFIVIRSESEFANLQRVDPVFVHEGAWPVASQEPVDGAFANCISKWSERIDRDAAVDRLVSSGVPCAPCLERTEIMDHPQVRANEILRTVLHAEQGQLRQSGPFAHFAGIELPMTAAPALGQHSGEILDGMETDASVSATARL